MKLNVCEIKLYMFYTLRIVLSVIYDISFYQCCPGYVATDMSSHKGTLTIDEGESILDANLKSYWRDRDIRTKDLLVLQNFYWS